MGAGADSHSVFAAAPPEVGAAPHSSPPAGAASGAAAAGKPEAPEGGSPHSPSAVAPPAIIIAMHQLMSEQIRTEFDDLLVPPLSSPALDSFEHVLFRCCHRIKAFPVLSRNTVTASIRQLRCSPPYRYGDSIPGEHHSLAIKLHESNLAPVDSAPHRSHATVAIRATHSAASTHLILLQRYLVVIHGHESRNICTDAGVMAMHQSARYCQPPLQEVEDH